MRSNRTWWLALQQNDLVPLHYRHPHLSVDAQKTVGPAIQPHRNAGMAPTTSGRWVSECGQMGVIRIASTLGINTGPPAASEYAVEPVGVEMIHAIRLVLHTRSSLMVTAKPSRRATVLFTTHR